MQRNTTSWNLRSPAGIEPALPAALLRVVDAGLCGVIFVAPYVFGGRHDLGRLVFVSFVAVTAAAWFLRQAIRPYANWPSAAAHGLLLATAALVLMQIVPLPSEWLARLTPRTSELLPLWSTGAEAARLGTWQTISLVPHETTKALAMALSYGLLFVVVSGRIGDYTDIFRLLNWIGVAATLMALFGLAQYATSDGKFFWFYDHPHRSAAQALTGPFINRNHFASFLVLGVGPLVGMYLMSAANPNPNTRYAGAVNVKRLLTTSLIAVAIALVVACILLSRSRGGAVVMLVSGIVLTLLLMWRGLIDHRLICCLIGLGIAVTGLLAMYGDGQAFDRFEDLADGSFEKLDHNGIREKLWSANLAAFRDSWLTGFGVGSHRDVCPIYLPHYFTKEYTHAENGYLQVASEAGIGGIGLLATGFGLVVAWCVKAYRRLRDAQAVRLLAITAAGLAASAAHAVVDFVWYIPACMSIVIILAACALRLAQLSSAADSRAVLGPVNGRARRLISATTAILVGCWAVSTYFGPGIAAVHWDRYLRASVAYREAARRPSSRAASDAEANDAELAVLNDVMLSELENVVRWDSQFSRAHLKLAARYVTKFDREQQSAANAIGLTNICDVIERTDFQSSEVLAAWLERAIGKNLELLRRAADEARICLSLSPLQGEACVLLARLAFLNGIDAASVGALTNQALLVRPHSAEVLFEIGRMELAANNLDGALAHWQKCFGDAGPHQQKIVSLLAGRIPSAELLAALKPGWPDLRDVWARYRESGSVEDLDVLLAYSLEQTRKVANSESQVPVAIAWYWQSQLFAEVGQAEHALACLNQAYANDSRHYSIRYALARALFAAGRLSEAEPHYRWCLARRPMDKTLTTGLSTIAKTRLADRGTLTTSHATQVRRNQSTSPPTNSTLSQ